MENLPKKFPVKAEDYKLFEEVGQGVSASVYRALCIPLDEIVAIKVMDLERCGTDLDIIRREVHTMTLLDHPNLLKAHCSFVAGSSLWIVTPYMDCGSCFHIMKFVHPNGFQQSVIATLLLGVLKALVYLHSEGLIHRDVKAGNVLVDSKGAVKLADFGVSASLFDNGDRRHARNTFVGTPCWMAPEVMQQLHGYDFKADIWSFGITALELAHGHAPFSNYPPMKVLLMTIQNAPPGLDYARDKKFSKSFKNLVSTCLVKDPKKRPTAENLLKHRFFKYAQPKEYVVHTILRGLPPLGDRYRMIKEKEVSLHEENKVKPDDKEQISQKEYIRGISAWDFDPKNLKIQAALLGDDSDDDDNSLTKNHDLNRKLEKMVERSNHSDLDDSVKSCCTNLRDLDGLPASLPNNAIQGLESDLMRSPGKDIGVVSPSGITGVANLLFAGENSSDEASSSMSIAQFVEKPDPGPKDIPNGSASGCSKKSTNSMPATIASMIPSLQYLLEQNSIQKDQIMKCLEYLEQANVATNCSVFAESVSNNEHIQICDATPREKFLESQLISMKQYNDKLLKDLEIQKMESAKLEQKLKALIIDKE